MKGTNKIKRLIKKIGALTFAFVFLVCQNTSLINAATLSTNLKYIGYDASWSDQNQLVMAPSTMDGNISYCIDYARPLSDKSSSYSVRSTDVSSKLKYVLMNGYPNKDLGLGSKEKNYFATQLAVWAVGNTSNGTPFSMSNLRANSGYETFLSQTISKAKQLVSAANKNSSYSIPNPSFSIDSSKAKTKVSGDQIIFGPYKVTLKNGSANTVKASLQNAPSSAKITDKNGNTKSSFSTSDEIYVRINKTEKGSNAKLNLSVTTTKYTAKIYSTNEAAYTTGSDGKNKYYQSQLVLVGENVNLSDNVQFKWDTIKGSIKIYKVDQFNKKIKGVVFELYNSSSQKVATGTTDKNGELEFENLDPGVYKIKEKSTIEGYTLNTNESSLTVKAGEQSEIKIINQKILKGSIKIYKVDQNGTKLKGVVFELYDSNSKKVSEATTDKKGEATFTNLDPGVYKVKEKTTIYGYKLDSTVRTITVKADEESQLKIINQKLFGTLKIEKLDSKTNEPIEGVKFEIYNSKGKVVDTIKTDKDGIAESKKLDVGQYTFKEVSAPDGYIVNSIVQEFSINQNNLTAEKTIFNSKNISGNLNITKVDEDTNDVIPGAIFELYNESGDKIADIKTDDKGEAIVAGLAEGKYTLKEVSAPTGYIITQSTFEFEINDSNTDVSMKITNKKESITGVFKIIKIDEESKERLAGVTFELYTEEGTKVADLVTNGDGEISVSGLPVGKYVVKEVSTLTGYVITQYKTPFEITNDNLYVEKTITNKKEVKLVQTGDFGGTDIAIIAGTGAIAVGIFFVIRRRMAQ